jgi:hypothetical protein
MTEPWRILGDFIDFCSCSMPCPCTFAQPGTDNHCKGTSAYRIREGNYGNVDLTGLNVVGVAHLEGSMWDPTYSHVGMIFDARADPQQLEALQTIFSGRAGGWPATFADTVFDNKLEMEVAPIDLRIDDDLESWSLTVPDRVEGQTKLLTGPTTRPGERMALVSPPGAEVGPSAGAATYGIASTDKVSAFGLSWERTGRSSKHIPFEWFSDDEH